MKTKISATPQMLGKKAYYEYSNSSIHIWQKGDSYIVGFTLSDPILEGTLEDVIAYFDELHDLAMQGEDW